LLTDAKKQRQQVAADLLKKNVRQWETEVRNARAINGEAAQSPLANFHVPDLNLSPERNKNRHLKKKTPKIKQEGNEQTLVCVGRIVSGHVAVATLPSLKPRTEPIKVNLKI